MVINNNNISILPSDELPNPFGQLGLNLSESELRETAYEILVGACRSSGGKSLTFISQSEKTTERVPSMSSLPSLQRSLTSTAASKVKKALGLKSSKKNSNSVSENSVNSGKAKRPVTVGELVRLGRRIESMVLPLELLQQLKSSDFPNQREYEAWQKRNLKVLEVGLLLHPHLPLDKTDNASQQLRQIIRGASERPIETGKHSESMQVLRRTVMSLACRSFDGSVSETCHWADGVPLNLHLYQMLLEAFFDVNEETTIVEEVDEILELIKKTWIMLGINQMLHNLCFSWILFHRYVATGQIEDDLLFAASNLLLEVEKDAKATKDPVYSKILSSTLSLILGWAEKRLLAYHDTFYHGNIDTLQNVLSLGVSAANILVKDISHEYRRKRKEVDVAHDRVDTYIRSSVRSAFAQEMEKIKSSKRLSKDQRNPLPVLSILAQDINELAFNEKEIYSPVLKRWHPLAAGVAVATLHACYGNELKQFVSGISELTPDAVQVLLAADKLEKDLVQIAVEDSVDRQEWTDLRNGLTEICNKRCGTRRANKQQFAPSAVEVLRIMDETLEAFFMLPIPMHPVLLSDLMSSLDRCLQHYVLKAKSGCGSRSTFVPTMPTLTRCTTGSKFHGVFKKKDRSHIGSGGGKPQVGTINGGDSFGIPQLCVRMNTLHHIRTELGVLEKRTITHLRNSGATFADESVNGSGKKFELSAAACVEEIQQLCEATAYKIIFHDLTPVLWDGLYVGEVSSSRIEPLLQELEQNLEIISATVHDRVRTRLITDIMKASFDGFLLVLLAGGPSRAFTQQDSVVIEEDFKFLMDLFWSNGDGLPADLIDKHSTAVKRVLSLFHTDTESLIEQFRGLTLDSHDFSAKPRLPLPPTSGHWSPTEPNTLLRVLCYRNDMMASKFLKKTYNLPKKL
ncbi:hypothetical protein F0562_009579 [Nyssa sinensis]|uniref:MHD1 domain-containing protein n=1 Tax=Nyssa sinensis TaxID=561372 RepID=A0A5J4ZZD4_9ASTE|nr:hypothetical protein F0562_009579 [Nyssa sinensis]